MWTFLLLMSAIDWQRNSEPFFKKKKFNWSVISLLVKQDKGNLDHSAACLFFFHETADSRRKQKAMWKHAFFFHPSVQIFRRNKNITVQIVNTKFLRKFSLLMFTGNKTSMEAVLIGDFFPFQPWSTYIKLGNLLGCVCWYLNLGYNLYLYSNVLSFIKTRYNLTAYRAQVIKNRNVKK